MDYSVVDVLVNEFQWVNLVSGGFRNAVEYYLKYLDPLIIVGSLSVRC